VKFLGYLVLEKGVGQVEVQFLAVDLIQIQGEPFLDVLMHPLAHQAPGKVLQVVEFPAALGELFLAVAVQGHQLVWIGQGRFGKNLRLPSSFLLQEVQQEREDLQGGVHPVDDAQAAAAHTGVAIVAHQFLEAMFQDCIGRRIIRRRG